MQKRLIKNSTWSFAAKIAATVLFFAADILIARLLGIEKYAEWAFFYAILSMMYYFFWFGINSSTKVFVSKTERQAGERVLCIQAGIRARTAASLVLAAVSVAVILLLPLFPFYRGLTGRYPHLHTLLLISPLIAGLNSFAEFFKETEIGVQDYRGVFTVTTLEYAMIMAAGVVSAAVFRSSMGVGAGYLAAYGVTFLAGFALIRKRNGIRTCLNRSRECGQYAGKILRYAVPLALIGIGGIILVEMDTFMLGMMSTPENVSDYAIAKQICTKASHINNALAMGTVASFSMIRPEEYPEKRRAFSRVARINLLITLGTGLAMLLLADFAIHLLYGETYGKAAGIIRCLVPYYILYGLSSFYALFHDFHGRAGSRSFWYAVMVAINFALNLLLIPPYGTTGACIATAVSLVPYTAYLVRGTYHSIWKELKESYEKR